MRQQYEKYTFASLGVGFILHIFVPPLLLLSNIGIKTSINFIQLTGIALYGVADDIRWEKVIRSGLVPWIYSV